jgi:hypothetical protein
MDRRLIAACVIGAVAVSAVAGYLAGSRITSPADVASRTEPPAAAPILVPVEQRVLSTDVVTRGTGRFGSAQTLSSATSALKPGPGLVAELPLAGTQLDEGDIAVSASGRPVFVLAGARPMSRDLGPGLAGDDVLQLEESLSRLGFEVGDVDGTYDEATAVAVAGWYEANGFAPFEATTAQLADIRSRERELSAARADALAAVDASAAAGAAEVAARSGLAAAMNRRDVTARAAQRAVAEADAATAVADAELAARQDVAERLRAGATAQRGTPAEIAVARADIVAAESSATAIRTTGQQSVAAAQSTLDRAPAQVSSAISSAAAADAAARAEVASRQAALDAVQGQANPDPVELGLAVADLAAATANAENVRIAGVESVTGAQQAAVDATAALDAARSQAVAADAAAGSDVAAKRAALDALLEAVSPTPGEIAGADFDVAVATANRDTVILTGERSVAEAAVAANEAAGDVAVKQAELDAAETALANAGATVGSRATLVELAADEADLARRGAGVQVPADEVVFVATVPVRVSELLVGLGDSAVGGLMTVTDALVHVDAALPVEDAGLIEVGMAVQIDEPDLGISATGVVAAMADGPGTNGVDGFHVYADISVETPPPNLVGASVRLTIPVGSTGDAVLAVPISALTLGPDGSSRVQRQVAGSPEYVGVEAGLSADGFVEVVGTRDALHAGDLVVIGFEAGGAASTPGSGAASTPPSISSPGPASAVSNA